MLTSFFVPSPFSVVVVVCGDINNILTLFLHPLSQFFLRKHSVVPRRPTTSLSFSLRRRTCGTARCSAITSATRRPTRPSPSATRPWRSTPPPRPSSTSPLWYTTIELAHAFNFAKFRSCDMRKLSKLNFRLEIEWLGKKASNGPTGSLLSLVGNQGSHKGGPLWVPRALRPLAQGQEQARPNESRVCLTRAGGTFRICSMRRICWNNSATFRPPFKNLWAAKRGANCKLGIPFIQGRSRSSGS